MAKDKIAKRSSTAIQGWEEDLAREARDEKAKETLGVPRITHKSGVLQIDDKPVEGNKLTVAVVDYIFSKEYYDTPYQPNKAATPACYAFGRQEEGMVAHAQAPRKQNPQADGSSPCTGCKHNAFNTAEKGRGKACKDNRRLLVIHGVNDPAAIQKAETRQISIPPASLKGWGNYLTSLRDTTRTGNVREALTEIGVVPGKFGGHVLTFRFVGVLPPSAVQAIMAKRAAAGDVLSQPFPVLDSEEEPEQPKARSKKSNRKLD